MTDVKEEIKSKVDIVDLISRYISVKKAGSNYKASCPFHNEDTPSFMISPSLQIYKCFGCGKAGDVFTFLMDMEGIEFRDALERLAEETNTDISSYLSKSKNPNYQKLYDINELVKKYYTYTLLNLKVGKTALKYLKDRGLSKKHIKDFNLGYAPNSWDSLTNYLTKKGYSHKFIEDAGLVKRGPGGKYYDVYRGRIIFPLINERNKTVGFAGRTIINEDPKYINSKDTLVFKKSYYVYNLNKSKVEIKKKNQVVVCEGEFDAITPYIKGIKNIVALKGTSFTQGQAKLLKRYCDEAVIFFDNDVAGQEAALRGLEIAQNLGLNVKVASLSGNFKDPDEAAKKSIDILHKAIDNALFVYDYYILYITKKYDVKDPVDKTKIAKFLEPKISNIADPILKAHYTKKLSELIEVPEDTLNIQITNTKTKQNISKPKDVKVQKLDILSVYLFKTDKIIFNKYFKDIKKENLVPSSYIKLLQEYNKGCLKAKISRSQFIENSKNKERFQEWELYDTGSFENTAEIQEKSIISLIKKQKQLKIKNELHKLSTKISNAESLNDAKKLDKYYKKHRILSKSLSNLK